MDDSNITQRALCVLAGINDKSQGVVAGILGMYKAKANSESITGMFHVAFIVHALRSAGDEGFPLNLGTIKKVLALDDNAVVSAKRKPVTTTRNAKFPFGTDIHNKALNSRYKNLVKEKKKRMLAVLAKKRKQQHEPRPEAHPSRAQMKKGDFETVLVTVRREAKKRAAAGTATPKTKALACMSSPEYNSNAHINYVRNIWNKKTDTNKTQLESSVTVSPPVAKKAKKKQTTLPIQSDSDSDDDAST